MGGAGCWKSDWEGGGKASERSREIALLLLLALLVVGPLHAEEAKPNKLLRQQFEEDMVGLSKAYRTVLDPAFNEREFRSRLKKDLDGAQKSELFTATPEEAAQLAAGRFLIAKKPFAEAMRASRNDFTIDWYKFQKSLNPCQQLLAFRLAQPVSPGFSDLSIDRPRHGEKAEAVDWWPGYPPAGAATASFVLHQDAPRQQVLDVAQGGVGGAFGQLRIFRRGEFPTKPSSQSVDDLALPLVRETGPDTLPRFGFSRAASSCPAALSMARRRQSQEPHEPRSDIEGAFLSGFQLVVVFVALRLDPGGHAVKSLGCAIGTGRSHIRNGAGDASIFRPRTDGW